MIRWRNENRYTKIRLRASAASRVFTISPGTLKHRRGLTDEPVSESDVYDMSENEYMRKAEMDEERTETRL